MTEVLGADGSDNCNIILLVRRSNDDRWENHGSILRVRRAIYDRLLDWVSDEEPPEWWEGKKNG